MKHKVAEYETKIHHLIASQKLDHRDDNMPNSALPKDVKCVTKANSEERHVSVHGKVPSAKEYGAGEYLALKQKILRESELRMITPENNDILPLTVGRDTPAIPTEAKDNLSPNPYKSRLKSALQNSESRVSVNSNSRTILPITDGDEDDDDGNDDQEEEEEQEVLSNRAYDTRLRNVFFPKNNFDSHDEYCDEIQLTINQSLAVGLKDKDIAIILRSHIQKTNLRSAFQTELRGKLNPTTKQIMRAQERGIGSL